MLGGFLSGMTKNTAKKAVEPQAATLRGVVCLSPKIVQTKTFTPNLFL